MYTHLRDASGKYKHTVYPQFGTCMCAYTRTHAQKPSTSETSLQSEPAEWMCSFTKWLLWYALTLWNKMWRAQFNFSLDLKKFKPKQFKRRLDESDGPLCCLFGTFRVQTWGTLFHCCSEFVQFLFLHSFLSLISVMATSCVKTNKKSICLRTTMETRCLAQYFSLILKWL